MTTDELQAIEGRHADDTAYCAAVREVLTLNPERKSEAIAFRRTHEDRGLLLAEVRRLRECLTRLTTGADCPACGHPYWRHRWDDALGQYLHPRLGAEKRKEKP